MFRILQMHIQILHKIAVDSVSRIGTSTDLTGKNFTADEVVQALNIPVRGTDCSAEQAEMDRQTRGTAVSLLEEVPAPSSR